MAVTKKKKPGIKRSEKDDVLESVDMFKMWLARKQLSEICTHFGGISERTAQRRIATGKAIVEAAQAIVPDGYVKIKDPETSSSQDESPKQKVEPGVISQGLVVRAGPSNHGAINFPKTNPLAGITDIAEMSKVGLQIGVVAGGAAHDIQEAFTRTDLPLDERMLTLSRGSSVAANAILGGVGILKQIQPREPQEIQDV